MLPDPAEPNASAAGGDHARYSGRAVMIGVLGIALIMIGVMLVATLDAPVVRARTIIIGFVLIVIGTVLLPVAWIGRAGRQGK